MLVKHVSLHTYASPIKNPNFATFFYFCHLHKDETSLVIKQHFIPPLQWCKYFNDGKLHPLCMSEQTKKQELIHR